jgi:hypothetical protein
MSAVDEFNASVEGPLADVVTLLAERLDAALPGLGRVWQGHPVWLEGKQPIAGYKPFPRWVTFMIWGDSVVDTSGALLQGPRMATIKFTSVDEVDETLLNGWLAQVAR